MTIIKGSIAVLAPVLAVLAMYFPANAQQPMARCVDMSKGGVPYIIMDNGYTFQENFPMNAGFGVRDPSGQTFMRLPAQNPMTNAYFMSWQGELIELSILAPNPTIIGRCTLLASMPAPPPSAVLPDYQYTQGAGVIRDEAIVPVPQRFYRGSMGFSPPPSAPLNDAKQCMSQSGDNRQAFMDCLVPKMMTSDQVKAYNCMRTSPDRTALATCLAGNMMGQNEREALRQAENCYRQYATKWDQYPLCLANQNFDPKIATAVNCLRQQAQNPNASAWGIAGCVAGNALNLNPELTVASECAMASGGVPLTFAGCTGGRLTAMELNKCFTHGIGGNGCFGQNNEIVKGLRSLGVDLQQILGPNGFVVQNWNNAVNDLQNRPGPNNEVVKAFRTMRNDLHEGLGENNDIRRALTDIGLGGLF